MNVSKWIGSALVASALTFGAATAFAGADGKIYPGSMCVGYKNAANSMLSYSRVGNKSKTTDLYADCVGVKDVVGKGIKSGWVQAIDQHYSDDVSCTLASVFWDNGTKSIRGWFEKKKTSGSSKSSQFMHFKAKPAKSVGHYYYSCKVPERYKNNTSYVVNYKIEER